MTKSIATNRARRWVERLLLVAGLSALGVWAGQYVVSRVWQAWANRQFDAEMHEREIPVESAHVAATPAAQGRQVSQVTSPGHRSTLDDSTIGRLTIPRLHLSAMVREGVGEETLSLALGHVPSTALPGQEGNVAVAGHRDTLFRDLRFIKKYDLIRFETLYSGSHLYEVRAIEIVDPANVSVLRAGRDPELTLVTCYPFDYVGAAPRRFIVKAREVDRAPVGMEGQ